MGLSNHGKENGSCYSLLGLGFTGLGSGGASKWVNDPYEPWNYRRYPHYRPTVLTKSSRPSK